MDSCSTSTSTPYLMQSGSCCCSLGWKSSSFVGGFNSNNGVFVRPTNNRISSTRVNMVRASASSSSSEFEGNCFLWGVFRCPKDSKNAADAPLLLQVKCEPCDDVPPGFKKICKPRG